MLEFTFMQHAFIGCFLVSILAGSIGWLMMLRRQTFAAHALPHIGFSGAAASIWLGLSPLTGMIASSLIGGLILSRKGKSKNRNPFSILHTESLTGLVLAASLGIGVLCLHEANSASSQTNTLLFGDVLSLSTYNLLSLTLVLIICLIALSILWKPLIFSSLAPDLAEAKGVSLTRISITFMGISALATSACSEVAGALLSFSLMIGPAATSLKLELSPIKGILSSIGLALALSWLGLILSWYTDIPISFWISIGAILLYGMSCLYKK